MARKSAGDLVVQIQADAKGLNSVIDGAEAKLLQFGQKMSRAFTTPFAGGLMGGLAGSIMPGIALGADAIFNPIRNAESSMERLVALGKSAEDIGVSPKFMRGLQIAAGPEVEAVEKAVIALMNLKAASNDTGSSEAFIRNIIRQGAAITDAAERIKFATDQVGLKKAMGLVELFQKGEAGLDKAISQVDQFGLAVEANIRFAELWKKSLKEAKLAAEGFHDASIGSGGLMSLGGTELASGMPGQGLESISRGAMNYLNRFIPGGVERMTADMGQRFLGQALDDMRGVAGGLAGDKLAQAQAMIGQVEDLQTKLASVVGGFQMERGMADEVAKRVAQVQSMAETKAVPKPMYDEAARLQKSQSYWAEQSKSVQALSMELETLAGSFGMTTREAELYAAAVRGASSEQLDLMAGIRDQKDAAAILAANKSPADLALENLTSLDELRGTLGDEAYGKALRRMRTKPADITAGDAATALVGSQEWAKAFNRANEPAQNLDEDQLSELRKSREVQESIDKRLERLNERKPAVLQLPPGG